MNAEEKLIKTENIRKFENRRKMLECSEKHKNQETDKATMDKLRAKNQTFEYRVIQKIKIKTPERKRQIRFIF